MAGNKGMEKLIPLVNQLQDVFAFAKRPLNLDLPQIAVVGSQSAGKSSVLENFVGRRPLILQLVNDTVERGEFVHCRDKTFRDFEDIKREIEAETDRGTGGNKGISNVPINLKIYSPNGNLLSCESSLSYSVLNLTLIDLPGLTKVPVGDQPPDIELQIRQMIAGFIDKENCLILAVTPANTDLANSDALKLAMEFDKKGLRTIGVLTKLDLMDEGTNAINILENKVFLLRRGYVGVVNRSQQSINKRVDITTALKAEREFFLNHASYRDMADRMGTPYLQKVLNEQLTNHIRQVLPNLHSQLQKELQGLEKEVEQFQLQQSSGLDMRSELFRCARIFESDILKSIEGVGDVDVDNLSSGAQIGNIITNRYKNLLGKIRHNDKHLRKDINIIIQNIHAVRKGFFTPDTAFYTAVRKIIEKTRKPTLDCLEMVMEKLVETIKDCSESLKCYPKLQDEVLQKSNAYLRTVGFSIQEKVGQFVDMQLAYINTCHDDFIGFKRAETQSEKYDYQVILSGWLSVSSGTLKSSRFWFVLSTVNFKWFKDDEEREVKQTIDLQGLRQRSGDSKSLLRKNNIGLFYSDPKVYVYKDQKVLELSADSNDSADAWRDAFFRAGVSAESAKSIKHDKENSNDRLGSDDSKLRRQVETVFNLVKSYMKIVTKIMLDTFPKLVMHQLLNKLKQYIDVTLPMELSRGNIDFLMKMSETEEHRRQEVLKMYETIKHALKVITDTVTTN